MTRHKVEFPLRCEIEKLQHRKDREWWYDANDQPVCGSPRRKAKERGLKPPHDRCTQSPLKGRNRCRIHGGETPRGEESVDLTTAEFSYRHRNVALAETFERVLSDPEILNLSREISLFRSRIQALLLAGEGELGQFYIDLQVEAKALDAAIRVADGTAVVMRMQNVLKLAQRGASEGHRWNEIYRVSDGLRRLIAADQNRRIKMQEVVRAEDFMLFITRLGYIVNTAKNIEQLKRDLIELIDDTLGVASRPD